MTIPEACNPNTFHKKHFKNYINVIKMHPFHNSLPTINVLIFMNPKTHIPRTTFFYSNHIHKSNSMHLTMRLYIKSKVSGTNLLIGAWGKAILSNWVMGLTASMTLWLSLGTLTTWVSHANNNPISVFFFK